MLSKPDIGWTVFSLGDFQAEVSYLVDIPFDWLISCKNALKHNIPASFFLELEGESCIVASYGNDTHIIYNHHDGAYTLTTVHGVDFMDLSAMLLKDIRLYFEDWVTWYNFEQTESDFARRRVALKALIEETEAYLAAIAKKCNKQL
ncbi:MAG: hypothetical protein J5753_04665 [Oscillospiraceae bacterium]|nr:hypothetical protein [Oscillospiraceae bacterium]